MSRSYRRPYASISGVMSAKDDKRRAHRGQRRKQNHYLKLRWEDEDFLLPHFRECHHNDVWSWVRDGRVRLAYELRYPGRQKFWETWYERCSHYTQKDIDERHARDAEYLRSLYRK